MQANTQKTPPNDRPSLRRAPSFASSPMQLLATIASAVIRERWNTIRTQKGLDSAPQDSLALALSYLTHQVSKMATSERRASVANSQNRSEDAEEPMSDFSAFAVLTIAAIVVVAAVTYLVTNPTVALYILCVALFAITFYKAFTSLLATFGPLSEKVASAIPSHYAYLLFMILCLASLCVGLLSDSRGLASAQLAIMLQVIAIMFTASSRLFAHGGLVPLPLGALQTWTGSTSPERAYLQAERSALLDVCAMSQEGPTSDTTTSSKTSDLESLSDTPLPAPPGITEVVLEDSAVDTFEDMRAHLADARKYHRIVLWALICAFMAFFAVSIYKFISGPSTVGDFVQAFGSAGVGGALFWFGTRVLWTDRLSQLSLALFDSYLLEVQASLREIPANFSPGERRKIRMDVWSGFRKGLNQIWLAEESHLKSASNPPTAALQDGDIANE